jgi:predicted DNA-binding ribbon-helix-helix protein
VRLAGGTFIDIPVTDGHVQGNLATAPAWPAASELAGGFPRPARHQNHPVTRIRHVRALRQSRPDSLRIALALAAHLRRGDHAALENQFWDILSEIAEVDGMTTNQLIAKLYEEVMDYRGEVVNFASFLRVSCTRYLSQRRVTEPELSVVRAAAK